MEEHVNYVQQINSHQAQEHVHANHVVQVNNQHQIEMDAQHVQLVNIQPTIQPVYHVQ